MLSARPKSVVSGKHVFGHVIYQMIIEAGNCWKAFGTYLTKDAGKNSSATLSMSYIFSIVMGVAVFRL